MTTLIDYNSLTTGWIGFFKANSATIDSGLYKSITSILDADYETKNLYITRMPGITVNLAKHNEERIETGSNGVCRNRVECIWEIGCHIYDIGDYEQAREDARTLVANVESAIRGDDTASGTFHSIYIDDADFDITIQGKQGTYQKSALINVITENYV